MAIDKSNKTRLFVRQDVGKGKLVVLLHGLFADGTQWIKITNLLVKSGHRVVVLDLLGHGRSPRAKNQAFNAAENVNALHNSLADINATKDATVVGYSMGGAVAVSYSAKYPQNVSQLVIISTPFYLKPEQMLIAKYASSVFVTKASVGLFSLVNYLLKPGKFLAKAVGIGDKSKKFHQMIGAYDNKLDPNVIRKSITNLVQKYDFAGELTKVKAPTSFYCGKKDAFIVQGQLYALKKFNPYMHIERLDVIKIDHMLVQNLPKEITSIITKNDNRLLNIALDTKKGEPLILIHGIESSSTYWDSIVKPLSEHSRVIVIDLLGYGKSPKPNNIAYNTNDHINAIHSTLSSLKLNNYKIAAHSLGSVLALAYAAKYSKEVNALYLFAPVFTANQKKSKKFILNNINLINVVSDTGIMHSEIAKAIGDKRLSQLLPTFRTIQNTIHKQQPAKWIKNIINIPVTFTYGTYDQLVDSHLITNLAKILNKSNIITLKNKGHNFVLTDPDLAISAITGNKYTNKVYKNSIIPSNFIKQIAKLAAPTLILKSLVYIIFGLLLFSQFVAYILTIGLAFMVINKSYKIVRAAFSLKNEGLSYIGYFLLGLFVAIVGYGLLKHPELSVKVSIYFICIVVLLAGILRLLAAALWTKKRTLKNSLFISGSLMTLFGLAAIFGSINSIYFIIYSIAIYLVFRGLLYGFYAFSMLAFAFMRGYNKV